MLSFVILNVIMPTLIIMTLNKMTLSVMGLYMALSINATKKKTLSITVSTGQCAVRLSVNVFYCYAEYHYHECY